MLIGYAQPSVRGRPPSGYAPGVLRCLRHPTLWVATAGRPAVRFRRPAGGLLVAAAWPLLFSGPRQTANLGVLQQSRAALCCSTAGVSLFLAGVRGQSHPLNPPVPGGLSAASVLGNSTAVKSLPASTVGQAAAPPSRPRPVGVFHTAGTPRRLTYPQAQFV